MSANKRKYLISAAVMVITAGLIVMLAFLWKYSPYQTTNKIVGNPRIILSLKNVEVIGRSGGKKIWSFEAKRANVSRGRFMTELIGIYDGRLFSDGKQVVSLNAGRAVYDSSTGDVEVTGGVRVVSVQGYTAQTEQARWSNYMKELRCPGKVSLATNGSVLVGRDLVANIDNQEIRMDKAKMVVEIGKGNTQ
ncbi:MAG: LPS export ABC transporter periplasmic protein LptC [Armatimonadota bacterium]